MLLFLQSSGVLSLCLALYLGATHGKAPETRRGTGELSSGGQCERQASYFLYYDSGSENFFRTKTINASSSPSSHLAKGHANIM